ncbi:M48 family metallopeptidase [Roseomonas sp. 18066]|uniref:M48 family metallopeptidase n=1 Tax=Roseomonas sp. 18066 TaxID=2681412 RepID=UPI00135A4A33|nr:M48 family metallopeptidase [Roseomonas sp. 18066]
MTARQDKGGAARGGWRRGARLVALTVLLPLAFSGIGLWQAGRVATTARDGAALVAALERAEAELRALAEKSPQTRVRIQDRLQTAPVAAALVADRLDDVRRVQAVTDIRAALPFWTLLAGGLAAALGAAGLLAAIVIGRLGRASRQALLAGFGLVRRLLPAQMAAQILLITAAALLALGFETAGLWHAGSLSQGDIKLMGVALFLGLGALVVLVQALRQLRAAWRLFTPDPLTVFGRRLDPAQAPGLWTRIEKLAAAAGATPPDHLVVGLTEGFFVTSSDVALQPGEEKLEGRTLYLPLPQMAMLDAAESGAIIGHELGHFTGEDTEYSRRFVPIHAGVLRSLEAVAASEGGNGLNSILTRPALLLGAFFLQQFDHAVHHWSRLREFAADAVGARVTSAPAAASALLRSSAIAPRIHEVLVAARDAPGARGSRDLLAEMLAAAAERGLDDPSRHLEDRQPHPTDTHPPDSQRLASLGQAVTPALLARATRPVVAAEAGLEHAFADAPGLMRQLSDELIQRLRSRDAAMAEALQEAAGAVQAEARLFYPNTRAQGFFLGGVGILFALGAVFCAALWQGIVGSGPVDRAVPVAGVALVLLAALMGLATWILLRRARHPFLRLTPDGFGVPEGPEIPWLHVADLAFQVTNGRLRSNFLIRPRLPLPLKLGKGMKLGSHNGLREVALHSYAAQGLTPQAFADLVVTYWRAAQARAELSERAARAAEAGEEEDADSTVNLAAAFRPG